MSSIGGWGVESSSKLCRSCGESLPLSQFHVYKKHGTPRPDCKRCHNIKSDEYRRAHPDECRAALRRSRELHLERRRAESREWRRLHREEGRRLTRAWTAANRDRVRQRNRARRAECLGACPRCFALVRATPKWLSAEHRKEIELFYLNCPQGMEVDHIVPIRGTKVSGLNTPWNLQYLTKAANMEKGNR